MRHGRKYVLAAVVFITGGCNVSAPSRPSLAPPPRTDDGGGETPPVSFPESVKTPTTGMALPKELSGRLFAAPQHAKAFESISSNLTTSFAIIGDTYFVGSFSGLSISRDLKTWKTHTVGSGLINSYVWSLYADSGKLYVGTEGGLSVTSDGGKTWQNQLTKDSGKSAGAVRSVAASGPNIFLCVDGKSVFVSNDSGKTWTVSKPEDGCSKMIISDDAVYSSATHRSIDLGKTWAKFTPEISETETELSTKPIFLIESREEATFLVSTSKPSIWRRLKLPKLESLETLKFGARELVQSAIAEYKGTIYVLCMTEELSVLASTKDFGKTWIFKKSNEGVRGRNQQSSGENVTAWGEIHTNISADDSTIYINTMGGLIYSKDAGLTWTEVSRRDAFGTLYDVLYLQVINDEIYAGTNLGLAFSKDKGLTWEDSDAPWSFLTAGKPYTAVHFDGTNFYKGNEDGLSISADNAKTWRLCELKEASGKKHKVITDIEVQQSVYYVATDIGLFISNDSCTTWSLVNSANGLKSDTIQDIFIKNDTIYLGTSFGLSTSPLDSGNWKTYVKSDGIGGDAVNSIYFFKDTFYLATSEGVSLSQDMKTFKNQKVFKDRSNIISKVIATDLGVFAGTPFGLAISIDAGKTWVLRGRENGLEADRVQALGAIKNSVYVGTSFGISVLNPSFPVN